MAYENEKRNFINGIEKWLEKSIGEPNFKDDNSVGYIVNKGLVVIHVFIHFINPNAPIFNIYSPIVKIPIKDLLSFYRKLLEFNIDSQGGTFAVANDSVVLLHSRPLLDLDLSEVYLTLNRFALKADLLAKELNQEYKCEILGIQEKRSALDDFFNF